MQESFGSCEPSLHCKGDETTEQISETITITFEENNQKVAVAVEIEIELDIKMTDSLEI